MYKNKREAIADWTNPLNTWNWCTHLAGLISTYGKRESSLSSIRHIENALYKFQIIILYYIKYQTFNRKQTKLMFVNILLLASYSFTYHLFAQFHWWW